jgi:hypothetical protein
VGETIGNDSLNCRREGESASLSHGGGTPHLASAILHHTDTSVTEAHYNRATGMSAANAYASINNL